MKKLAVTTDWLKRLATAPLKEGKVSPARYDKFRDKMVAFIDRPGNYDRAKHWSRRAELLDAVQTDELNPYFNKFKGKFEKSSAQLTSKARKKLSPGAFVFPEEKRYPIHDESHARNALARASGKPEEAKVRAAVHARYPGIGKIATVMPSFLDELENIELEKLALLPTMQEAGQYVRGIPGRAAQFAKELPGKTLNYAKNTPQRVQGGIKNVGKAVGNFAHPVENIGKGWDATWRPDGKALHPGFKALMAYGLYSDVKNTAAKVDPTGQGRSRVRRGLAAAGNQLGGLIAAPVGGFAGPMVGAMIGQKAGDLAGKGIDRLRGYRTPPTLPPPPVGQG